MLAKEGVEELTGLQANKWTSARVDMLTRRRINKWTGWPLGPTQLVYWNEVAPKPLARKAQFPSKARKHTPLHAP